MARLTRPGYSLLPRLKPSRKICRRVLDAISVITAPLEFFVSSLTKLLAGALSRGLNSFGSRKNTRDIQIGSSFRNVHSRLHRQSWGMCTPRHIERRIPTMLSRDSAFRLNDCCKGPSLICFFCARRENRQIAPFLSCGNSLKACPQNHPPYSRMVIATSGSFVKSDVSFGMKRALASQQLASARRDASPLRNELAALEPSTSNPIFRPV